MTKPVAKRVHFVSLKVIKEASVLYQKRYIKDPSDAAEIIRPFLEDLDREAFIVLYLSTKNIPTAIHTASIGSLNSSIVSPREIFKVAILSQSASIILLHNHPSGDVSPSSEDLEVTKRLVNAGDILGIEVLDHIIIGEDGAYHSLKEAGQM